MCCQKLKRMCELLYSVCIWIAWTDVGSFVKLKVLIVVLFMPGVRGKAGTDTRRQFVFSIFITDPVSLPSPPPVSKVRRSRSPPPVLTVPRPHSPPPVSTVPALVLHHLSPLSPTLVLRLSSVRSRTPDSGACPSRGRR